MTDLLLLIASGILILAVTYLPGFLAVRMLSGGRLLAWAAAPALGAAVAGVAAAVAPFLSLRWSLLPWALGVALLLGAAAGLRRLGVRLPHTALEVPPERRRGVPLAPLWITLAAAIAVIPIAIQARSADAALERWDTLYHLSALQRIRETGLASSLHLGSISNSAGEPTAYPAAFHALVSTVPGVPVPVLLNAGVLVLATVPWVLGIALLSRTLFSEVRWAPLASAIVAILLPAVPLSLWIHLSPIPNLTGFAALPGALAAAVALWSTLRDDHRHAGASLALVGLAGIGLGLQHPNVAVTALILLAVLTTVTGAPLWRRRPHLIAVPVLAALPVAMLTYTPLGSKVTDFEGGLQVPWWSALGEILLGLLTVWPMALGVVVAALWWPGLVTVFRTPQRWVGVAWIVLAVMYLDAALDSPLNLSILYYRGQDRLSMPLAMLSAVLVVPGLKAWSRVLPRPSRTGARTGLDRLLVGVLVAAALAASLGSVPARMDQAAKNLAPEYEHRGRFLQADERAAWDEVAPQMDKELKVLASPFSGAAHMYAIHGQDVHFPVAGMTLSATDGNLMQSVSLAGASPAHCQNFRDYGIGYVYQEQLPYQHSTAFDGIQRRAAGLGPVLFETAHSRLIEIDCTATEDL